MTDLEIALGNIDARMRLIFAKLSQSPPPDDEEGPLTNLAHLYRLRAAGRFLLEADLLRYVQDLQRSVQTRLAYLEAGSGAPPRSPRFFRTTRNRAFFDALAVNDLEAATTLAKLCDGIWVEKLEYEDDFLFVEYLQKFLLALRRERPPTATAEVLERYGKVLEAPEGSPYYQLCLGLEKREAATIESALLAITLRRAKNYAKLAELGDLPQVMVHTERYVDVQAVGILRLSTLAGISVERQDYPRIPGELVALAHEQHRALPRDAWMRP